MAKRGLGSDKIDKSRKKEIQSMGGRASGGNFANDRAKAKRAGQEGGRKSSRS